MRARWLSRWQQPQNTRRHLERVLRPDEPRRLFWRGFVGGLMKMGAVFVMPHRLRGEWARIDDWIYRRN